MLVNKSRIPVVLAFTPNYVVPAATCMASILQHADPREGFHFHCLVLGSLSDSAKFSLDSMIGENSTISYLDMEGTLKDVYVDPRYTEAASYRLLLPDLLKELDKVIYIDCDIIVRNDLVQLFRSIDLESYYLAAVYEPTLTFQEPYLEYLNITLGSYFNSGFLIMNLKKLRIDNMVSKFLVALKDTKLQFPDQDVLNMLCYNKVYQLPVYHNSIRTFFLPQYKSSFLKYYSEADWDDVYLHGTVHYTGSKPWDSYTVQFGLWWQYFERLPKDVKHLGELNYKMRALAKIVNTAVGGWSLRVLQNLYRMTKTKADD